VLRLLLLLLLLPASSLPPVLRRLAAHVVQGMEMLVCQSFAKNFGLYCERIGALHVVAGDAASAAAVLSMVEVIVRPMYSNPPAHGARVVAHILDSADLAAVSCRHTCGRAPLVHACLGSVARQCCRPSYLLAFVSVSSAQEWRGELLAAMKRVQRMRSLLRAALESRGTPGSWAHITDQIGMFSYTGLTKPQSTRMVEEFHVYMLDSGRINVAGLNEATVPILADAIHAVVTTTSGAATGSATA